MSTLYLDNNNHTKKTEVTLVCTYRIHLLVVHVECNCITNVIVHMEFNVAGKPAIFTK